MPLSAIFFDVGQTLCFADFSELWLPLHQRGIHPSQEQWNAALRATKPILDGQHADAALHAPDKTYWQMFYEYFLPELGIAESDANFLPLRDELTQRVRRSANWNQPPEGTHGVLARLAQRYKLGVISNADGKIEGMLRERGLTEHMVSVTDSGCVGVEKPHPQIFHTALASLGVSAHESLYVGDIYSVDYQGATTVGMHAVIMDAAGVYRGKDYPRIESLLELEGWLAAQGM